MNIIRRSRTPSRSRGVADGDVFAGCTDRERQRLDRLAAVVTVPAGRILAQQGRVGQEFGVILDGEAVVEVDGHEVARLSRGDHYGEIALLDAPGASRIRTATVTAVTDVSLAAMSVAEFRVVLDDMPEIANAIIRTAMRRVRAVAATV